MEKRGQQVLLVDDDKSLLDILGTILELDGHAVVKVSSARAGLLKMREQEFDLVLVDLKMPRTTGLDMLRAIREEHPDTKVVIMTAYASVNSTVEAMRLGVFDYLPKPFKLADLRMILDRAAREPSSSPPPDWLERAVPAGDRNAVRAQGGSEPAPARSPVAEPAAPLAVDPARGPGSPEVDPARRLEIPEVDPARAPESLTDGGGDGLLPGRDTAREDRPPAPAEARGRGRRPADR